MRAYALKSHIRSLGCELSRIGRSRNWQITASAERINDTILLIEQSSEDSWQWVAKKLRQDNQKLNHQHLIDIAKKNDGITINELMAKTDCTVQEARKVLDDLEWLEDE